MGTIDKFCPVGILDNCHISIDIAGATNMLMERTNIKYTIDNDSGVIERQNTKVANLALVLRGHTLHICGSIAKYYHEASYSPPLTRIQAIQAFERLSKELNIDLFPAKVTRVDMAADIIVQMKVKKYFHYFTDKPYHSRSYSSPTNLKFCNSQRSTSIYDKGAESGLSRQPNPTNLMRLEVRLSKDFINTTMKLSPTLSDFLTVDIFEKFIVRWHSEFTSIRQRMIPTFRLNNLYANNELIRQLAAVGMAALGGEETVFAMVDIARESYPPTYPEKHSRLRKAIKNLSTIDTGIIESCITVLNKQVEDYKDDCIEFNSRSHS